MHVASSVQILQIHRPAAAVRLLRYALSLWKTNDEDDEKPLRKLGDLSRRLRQAGCTLSILAWRPGILAIAKPPDCTSESILEQLRDRMRQSVDPTFAEFTSVSRLDFPTSGVLIVAHGKVNSVAANWLQTQFASRLVKKQYLCLVQGDSLGPVSFCGEISQPLLVKSVISRNGPSARVEPHELGQEAVTRFQVLGSFMAGDQEVTYLRVMPLTGRMHQIRVHFASIGRPLVPGPQAVLF
eukprot:Skav221293  [mRNA]  locus=scaffold2775:286295:287014:+ [translate_table: standard]